MVCCLGGADAARRALPAGFVSEKPHQVQRGIARAIVLRQHDDGCRADEAAVRLQRVEIERDVAQRRGQDAARRAARQVRIKIVSLLHAAAVFVDQLAHGDAGRREMDARMLHAARHRKRAQSLAAMTSLGREPVGAFFDNVAHPVERFHVVLERRPAEQAHLRNIRRTQPRHAALALDRLDHRRFFAADVRTGAAAQIDLRQWARRVGGESRKLTRDERATRRVFVA